MLRKKVVKSKCTSVDTYVNDFILNYAAQLMKKVCQCNVYRKQSAIVSLRLKACTCMVTNKPMVHGRIMSSIRSYNRYFSDSQKQCPGKAQQTSRDSVQLQHSLVTSLITSVITAPHAWLWHWLLKSMQFLVKIERLSIHRAYLERLFSWGTVSNNETDSPWMAKICTCVSIVTYRSRTAPFLYVFWWKENIKFYRFLHKSRYIWLSCIFSVHLSIRLFPRQLFIFSVQTNWHIGNRQTKITFMSYIHVHIPTHRYNNGKNLQDSTCICFLSIYNHGGNVAVLEQLLFA
jgi:hypothetical protein